LGEIPYAIALLSLYRRAFSQCDIDAAQLLLASREIGFDALSFSDLLGSDIDPNDLPALVFQRVPICDPDTISVRPIRSLTVDLVAGDRFACAQDRLHDAFNLLCDLRDRLTYSTANVVRDWEPANFDQVLIYHHVTTIGAKKSQTDRRCLVYQLKLRRVGQGLNWMALQ